LFFLISCRHTEKEETFEAFIEKQTEYVPLGDTIKLPNYIKSYYGLISTFMTNNGFDKTKYYVSLDTVNDTLYSDSTETYLSLRLFHLDYFSILYSDNQVYLKDSLVTFRKGNIGGKNFQITIDKLSNQITGPIIWK
jgi:hypothetical protein